jgi:hypothetical protein
MADSAAAVKLLMVATVGLSAWLNYEHGATLGYPLVARVLFAAPPVISGWLFELQLRHLHRARVHELGRAAQPLPQFGLVVWAFHPFAALKRVSQIAGSRLCSVPITVMDWTGAPVSVHELPGVPAEARDRPVLLAAQVEPEAACSQEDEARIQQKAGRAPVPDELYLGRLRELVAENGGVVPSIREVARQLSIGQDRARRLVGKMSQSKASQKGV